MHPCFKKQLNAQTHSGNIAVGKNHLAGRQRSLPGSSNVSSGLAPFFSRGQPPLLCPGQIRQAARPLPTCSHTKHPTHITCSNLFNQRVDCAATLMMLDDITCLVPADACCKGVGVKQGVASMYNSSKVVQGSDNCCLSNFQLLHFLGTAVCPFNTLLTQSRCTYSTQTRQNCINNKVYSDNNSPVEVTYETDVGQHLCCCSAEFRATQTKSWNIMYIMQDCASNASQ